MIFNFKNSLRNVAFDFALLALKACRWPIYAVVYRASYTIQLVTTGDPVNSYLTSTADKTHHGLVVTLFSVELLQFL